MNERIKELIAQASNWVEVDCAFGTDSEYQLDAEKFAQLIVQECMEQVWHTREDSIDGNISDVIKERMKKHFGVEE